MSFEKAFTTAVPKAKSTITRTIKDGASFSCLLQDIHITTEDGTMYPNHNDVHTWLKQLFSTELIPKPMNEKALAAMKAKGLTPSKSPREILLAVVTGSETDVHFAISIPQSMNIAYDDFIKDIVVNYNTNNGDIVVEKITDIVGEFIVCSFKSGSSLKERDDVQRYIFEELKKRKIYIPDEEDEMIFDF
jgi:hypothetical protein